MGYLVTCSTAWSQQLAMVTTTVDASLLRRIEVDEVHKQLFAGGTLEAARVPHLLRSRPLRSDVHRTHVNRLRAHSTVLKGGQGSTSL